MIPAFFSSARMILLECHESPALRPRSTRSSTPISRNTYEYAEDPTSLDADIGARLRKLIRKSTEFPLVSADIAVVNPNLQFGEDSSQGAPVSKP
jgi:hypothetical protein